MGLRCVHFQECFRTRCLRNVLCRSFSDLGSRVCSPSATASQHSSQTSVESVPKTSDSTPERLPFAQKHRVSTENVTIQKIRAMPEAELIARVTRIVEHQIKHLSYSKEDAQAAGQKLLHQGPEAVLQMEQVIDNPVFRANLDSPKEPQEANAEEIQCGRGWARVQMPKVEALVPSFSPLLKELLQLSCKNGKHTPPRVVRHITCHS